MSRNLHKFVPQDEIEKEKDDYVNCEKYGILAISLIEIVEDWQVKLDKKAFVWVFEILVLQVLIVD